MITKSPAFIIRSVRGLVLGSTVACALALGLASRAEAQGACLAQVSMGVRLPLLDLGSGVQVAYYKNIIRPNAPTLILLPGLFDGFYRHSLLVKLLEFRGINVVTLHLSVSPSVISAREMRGLPAVDHSGLKLEDLADQVRLATKTLGIRYPLPVSLSFSTALTQHFSRAEFPFIVDVAPIGRADLALDSSVKLATDMWQSWMGLFPGGRTMADSMMQAGLENHYRDDAKRIVQRFALPGAQQTRVETNLRQAFGQMSFAARDFDLREIDYSRSPFRNFILAAKESPELLKIQVEAAQKAQSAWGFKDAPVIVIPESGHTIPNDQPILLAAALEGVVVAAQRVFGAPEGPATPPPAAQPSAQ